MEPINCTVDVRKDGCDIWGGTQVIGAGASRRRADHGSAAGEGRGAQPHARRRLRPPARSRLHRPGRADRQTGRWAGENRLVARGRRPARHVSSLFLRPLAGRSRRRRHAGWLEPSYLRIVHHRALGAAGLQGRLRLRHRRRRSRASSIRFPNMRVDYVRHEPPGIPTAFWRSVGPSHNVFVVESFIDELAAAAKQDPIDYRRALLGKSPRAQAVLDLAAEKSGWGRGFAGGSRAAASRCRTCSEPTWRKSPRSPSAGWRASRVKRMICAVDCGIVINPDTIEAQVQSAIVYGLSAALYGEITLKDGRVEQSNFNDYRALRINEMPAIEVHIVKNSEAPGGMGEPGTSAPSAGRHQRDFRRDRACACASCRSTRASSRPSPASTALAAAGAKRQVSGMYAVKEIFYTLQGEGAQAGRPAVFCRFAGCNLWSGREEDRAMRPAISATRTSSALALTAASSSTPRRWPRLAVWPGGETAARRLSSC